MYELECNRSVPDRPLVIITWMSFRPGAWRYYFRFLEIVDQFVGPGERAARHLGEIKILTSSNSEALTRDQLTHGQTFKMLNKIAIMRR